ncbi:hypothetical protein TRVL_04021 [Trypanosoma vivax]|nr:hypothetical protein TRVL_04021 [Trypanosoma vivax]
MALSPPETAKKSWYPHAKKRRLAKHAKCARLCHTPARVSPSVPAVCTRLRRFGPQAYLAALHCFQFPSSHGPSVAYYPRGPHAPLYFPAPALQAAKLLAGAPF